MTEPSGGRVFERIGDSRNQGHVPCCFRNTMGVKCGWSWARTQWQEVKSFTYSRNLYWVLTGFQSVLRRSLCRATVLSRFSCVWLDDPMDCSPPGSSVHGILQARILKWVAMPSSKGSSQPKGFSSPRNRTYISCVSSVAGEFVTFWATWEAQLLEGNFLISDQLSHQWEDG